MKTNILLLLSVILININVFGQSEQLFDSYTYDFNYNSRTEFVDPLTEIDEDLKLFLEHLKSARDFNDLWMLDSIVSYDFITEIDSFSFERKTYTYNTTNNTVEYIIMQRLVQEEDWQNKTRSLLTFNEDGEQILSISFIWDDSQWVNDQKNENGYINNDLLEYWIRYEWDVDQWIKIRKFEFTYNENNLNTAQFTYDWIEDEGVWFQVYQVDLGYNDQGLRNYYLIYSLDFETNELYWMEKQDIIFNDSGLKDTSTTFRWDRDLEIWNNYDRLTFSYETEIRSYYNDYWDSTEWKHFSRSSGYWADPLTAMHNTHILIDDTLWLHSSKRELGYDLDGRTISQESYRYVEYMSYWLGINKFDRFYSDNGKSFAVIYYDWDVVLDIWDYDIKEETSYDENQIRDYTSTKQWNIDESIWESIDSQSYYYTNISSLNENKLDHTPINVYPNPCNKQLNLEFENLNNEKVEFKIYTILGKVVDEGILDPVDINRINVSHLENGFYMIQAVSGKKKYSGKFIKF